MRCCNWSESEAVRTKQSHPTHPIPLPARNCSAVRLDLACCFLSLFLCPTPLLSPVCRVLRSCKSLAMLGTRLSVPTCSAAPALCRRHRGGRPGWSAGVVSLRRSWRLLRHSGELFSAAGSLLPLQSRPVVDILEAQSVLPELVLYNSWVLRCSRRFSPLLHAGISSEV